MSEPTYSGPVYRPPPPDHPQTVTVLVLGIAGLVLCGVLAPFAWVIGNRVQREIVASQGQLGGQGTVQAGRVMGMIGTALLALGLLIVIGFVVIAVIGGAFAVSTGSSG